jgi:plasmid maintenance system antidote protein VapI
METKKIHIGSIVENAFNQSNMSKSAFAKAIGIHNQNIKREFEKQDWSVIKLIEAGKILEYDFSPLFSLGEKPVQQPKVILQIEVKEENISEVLKIIENKNLYNILKK